LYAKKFDGGHEIVKTKSVSRKQHIINSISADTAGVWHDGSLVVFSAF